MMTTITTTTAKTTRGEDKKDGRQSLVTQSKVISLNFMQFAKKA
jgi:hypothetical protein